MHQPFAAALGSARSRAKAKERAMEIAPQIDAAREAGHDSLRSSAAYLNGQQIPTPHGKQWTATAVANAQRYILAGEQFPT